jgi:ATP-dependent Clp protease ATP-binding subunit ClpB
MRLDKLTIKSQEAIQAAQALAESLGHPQLEPEHLLDALIEQQEGVVEPALRKLGVVPEVLRTELRKHFDSQS